MVFRHILLNVRLILIVIIILSTAKFSKNDTELNISNGIQFTPLHYDVELKFDVYKNVFYGKCNIIIQINYPTKNITIRRSGIFSIIEINLINKDDNQTTSKRHPIKVNIQKFSYINKTNIYLEFTQSPSVNFLSPGTYILKIIYASTILDNGDFFESFYTAKEKILNNEIIKVITAEELIPCWNEPIFKSTFNVSIHHHRNYKFLSNLRIRKTVVMINNMLQTHFDKSPFLSAQHLTIWIINTVKLTKYLGSTANVELWCRKEIINNVQFAENIAQGVVHFLKQKSAKIDPKIHYIATRDFQHSDIKIWGFIQLREEDIIYNDTLDHIARKMVIANYVAHQTISHWYDDVILWSKEGFITFLAAHILNQTRLIYRMMDFFVVQIQQESLRFDTLPDTDSLSLHTANISTVYSFRSSFHCIKSSIIWRMLYHLISDNVFWISINTYIDQYNQSNALQIDELWEIMQKSWNNSDHPHELLIKDIMNTWITQKHYSLFVERNYLDNKTIFWNINSKFDKDTKYSTLVTYMTKSKDYDYFWFDRQKSYWSFDETFDKHDWIIVNVHQIGYYRVNYNDENWEYLVHQLHENLTDIHVLNRAQIIDDAFEFYKLSLQRQLNFTMFWNITSFLFKDIDYVAWYPMIKAVEYMTCIWAVQDTVVLKHKINEMFYRLLQNIGYQEDIYENDFTKYLREEAVKWACVLGEPECRLIARSQLEKDLQNSVQDTPFKWKEWIYCKGLMAANDTYWVKIYEKWEKTGNNMLLEYLTCFTNPRTNRYYLRKTMKNEFSIRLLNNNMRADIVLLILAKHAKNDIVLEFMLQQLEFVKLSSKKQIDQIAIIIVIVTHDTSVDHFEKIIKFVENNLTISNKRLVDAIEQKIKKRRKEYQKQVENYESLNLF